MSGFWKHLEINITYGMLIPGEEQGFVSAKKRQKIRFL